ncbi:hypothetical protein RJF34_001702 [Campylobacter jejuni]|nr:hypothetical protein [Campylobacter jejuni]
MPREMFKNTISKFIYAKTKTICDELWDFRAKLINEENLPTSFFPRYDMEYIGNYGRKLEQWLNDDSRNDGAFVSFSADEKKFLLDVYDKLTFGGFLSFNGYKENEDYAERALKWLTDYTVADEIFYKKLYENNKALFEKDVSPEVTCYLADLIEAKFHTLYKKVFALFEAKIKDLDEMELFQPTKEEELKLILKHYPLSKIDFCFLPELKDKYETKEPNLFNDEELKPSKQSIEIKSYDEIMEAKLRKRGKF